MFSTDSGGRGIHSTKFTDEGLLRMIIYLKQSYYKKRYIQKDFLLQQFLQCERKMQMKFILYNHFYLK